MRFFYTTGQQFDIRIFWYLKDKKYIRTITAIEEDNGFLREEQWKVRVIVTSDCEEDTD